VLIFDTELEELESMVKQIARCGVDAVIVQDTGAVQLIRAIAPNLKIHGSTQMSITSTEGARFAQELGVARVVLGRELSLREIAEVRKGFGHEIEVFVHGALCVSYSGQCFSSEAWGGRSANRGQCAQACRLPYQMVLNGEEQDLGDIKYLLSPQDLMAVELVPDLIKAGVTCFKIEGRLKGPEYVALTTQVYRQAVDRAWQAMEASPETIPASLKAPFLTKEVRLELAQVFARAQDADHAGLTHGFLEGSRHQMLVRGRSPRHRGILVAQVERVLPGDAGVVVKLCGPLKRGDGVVFDRGSPEEREEGGHVYEILDARGRSIAATKADEVSEGSVTLTFGRRAVDAGWIAPGDLVWKNRDAALDKKLESLITGKQAAGATMKNAGVEVAVSGTIGAPLLVRRTRQKRPICPRKEPFLP
jgi:putative protease